MAPLRIANCSGFYGDRLSAAREMIDGGPIDFLTGDYLAELTMAILWRGRQRHPEGGYARSFLTQLEDILGDCLDRGIRIVVNAGGLNPMGLAGEIDALAVTLGLDPVVAAVTGDDIVAGIEALGMHSFENAGTWADTGREAITANAYLGCWGIVAALGDGADVVVTGRVTDAAVVMGPAAHHYGWARDDWNRLAGALVAGHIIECGAQTTGGNFSFFAEVPGLDHIGFPIVEMEGDGTFVVTKHPGTGGLVSTETVTAQLLYEIGGARYANPDVTARFDSIQLADDGRDRVVVSGVVGEPPPPDLKVAVNYLGGYRNRVDFVLTGPDIEAKAAAAESGLWRAAGGADQYEEAVVDLIRSDQSDPDTNEEAMAHLRVTVKDPDPEKVGRSFSSAAVELALASYPGFFVTDPPAAATPYAVYWPGVVPAEAVATVVHVGGTSYEVDGAPETLPLGPVPQPAVEAFDADAPMIPLQLGRVVGTRSGDKGGDANLGVWLRDPAGFSWLAAFLTVDRLRILLPDLAAFEIERHLFPNLAAINFVITGLLGQGVAASHRVDAQAKSLGEYLRVKTVEVPAILTP